MPRDSHVVTHSGNAAGGMALAMECLHCGNVQKFALPIAADVYLAAGKAFLRLHRGCKKPKAEKGIAT